METLFQSVLSASLWGSALTVIFLLVQELFKDITVSAFCPKHIALICNFLSRNKLPLSWQYYVWLVVLLRLIFPVDITVPVISLPWDTAVWGEVETAVIGEGRSPDLINAVQPGDIENAADSEELKDAGEIPVGPTGVAFMLGAIIHLVSFLWVLWIVPAIVIFIFKILSYLCCIKRLQMRQIKIEAAERNIFEDQLAKLGFCKKVKLFKSSAAQIPFTIGLFNPAVVLPDKKFGDLQLKHIFMHELKHIENRDITFKWLFEIAKCLHWFNPFVYIAASRAAFCAEACCDAAVLKDSTETDRREYSLTVVEVLRLAISPEASVHMSMGGNRADLKKRIQTILQGYEKKSSLLVPVFISVLMFGIYITSSLTFKEVLPDTAPLVSKEEASAPKKVLIPASTNILLVGMDKLGLADVIMLAKFDSEANKLEITSLPRDMYVESADIKLNRFVHLADNDINHFQNEVSSALAIGIDYCIQLDMEGFEKIVDAAGGLEMEIPEGGLYYIDPEQGLEIALPGGKQQLNGEKALHYVRYRKGYPLGDLQRISAQQQFLTELYKKIISGENLLEKMYALSSVLIENAKTNMTPEIAAEYLKYAVKLNKDSLTISTLAGEIERMDNSWYYVPAYPLNEEMG